jgi:molybdopterin synthase sulfur carrier subunit
MRITILAFGIAKEIMNGATVNIYLDEKPTVGALKELLEEQYPRLKELRSFLIAVNNNYISPSHLLRQEDEIAIIPPVSGG